MKKLLLCLGLLIAVGQSFAQTDDNKYQPVERNRRMPFVMAESYVKQDNMVIANYKTVRLDKESKKFVYSLPNGTVVAEATVKYQNAGKASVVTSQDNKKHSVGLKNITDMDMAREIAMFLSDNKYL